MENARARGLSNSFRTPSPAPDVTFVSSRSPSPSDPPPQGAPLAGVESLDARLQTFSDHLTFTYTKLYSELSSIRRDAHLFQDQDQPVRRKRRIVPIAVGKSTATRANVVTEDQRRVSTTLFSSKPANGLAKKVQRRVVPTPVPLNVVTEDQRFKPGFMERFEASARIADASKAGQRLIPNKRVAETPEPITENDYRFGRNWA
jgi:hypothetical protein